MLLRLYAPYKQTEIEVLLLVCWQWSRLVFRARIFKILPASLLVSGRISEHGRTHEARRTALRSGGRNVASKHSWGQGFPFWWRQIWSRTPTTLGRIRFSIPGACTIFGVSVLGVSKVIKANAKPAHMPVWLSFDWHTKVVSTVSGTQSARLSRQKESPGYQKRPSINNRWLCQWKFNTRSGS